MDIRKVLRKTEETETPEVNKVAVAYSIGLDSSLPIELLRRKYKAKRILPITIDEGQEEEEILESRGRQRFSRSNLPEIRSIKATGFDQRRCADAAYIWGFPYEILVKRKIK